MADAIEPALEDPANRSGAGKIPARANLSAFFQQNAMVEGWWPVSRDTGCKSLTVLYQR